jgi:hypothetical protein
MFQDGLQDTRDDSRIRNDRLPFLWIVFMTWSNPVGLDNDAATGPDIAGKDPIPLLQNSLDPRRIVCCASFNKNFHKDGMKKFTTFRCARWH